MRAEPRAPSGITPMDIYACDLDRVWLWVHGHVPRDKMRGAALSRLRYLDADVEPEQVFKGKVRHGWVLTVTGDLSGCGWDMSTFFEETEPQVVEDESGVRRWSGATRYDEAAGDDIEVDAEVVDGPHVATWLEMD